MSGVPVDPLDGPKWAAAGRVVAMDAAGTVIKAGVVYIDKGVIVAVQPAATPPPAGFEQVAPLQTHGTIFPGLIELHNHLCYNALPLWQVPKLFTNRDTWQGNADYKERVGKPMTLIGSTPQLMAALVRYVEVKSLVAGVTASQGITLSKFKGGAQAFFRGNIRNVEQTGETDLPGAHTHIGDIAKADASAAFTEQGRVKCYLQHLCEGTDAKARQHFLDLALSGNKWAIGASMTGIHSLALQQPDLQLMRQANAKIVWSPTSNLLLYGETAQIKAARDLGIPIGMGSDWSPSGSKNLLWELKVARAYSAQNGTFLTDRDLVAMVTSDAAKILGWDGLLGTLKSGLRADLMVLDKATGDPYGLLLGATEKNVCLVAVNGYVRYGKPDFVTKVHGAGEALNVAGEKRQLYMKQATADPRVAVLTYADARATLNDALVNFGTVAPKIVHALSKVPPPHLARRAEEHDEDTWVLAEHELRTMGIAPRPTVHSTAHVAHAEHAVTGNESYELDPLTVPDDPKWAARIKGQLNMPEFAKEALQPA